MSAVEERLYNGEFPKSPRGFGTIIVKVVANFADLVLAYEISGLRFREAVPPRGCNSAHLAAGRGDVWCDSAG